MVDEEDFYDLLFGLDNVPIPSARDRVNQDGEIFRRQIARQFHATMAQFFAAYASPSWPWAGPLFVALDMGLPADVFHDRDVDNLAKSVLDSLKGIIYLDDEQVISMFVGKRSSQGWSLNIGVKLIRDGANDWFVPMVRQVGRSSAG